MDLTLDAFMAQLGEASSMNPMGASKGMMQTAEMVAKRAKKDYGLRVDDAQYVLKDWVSDIDKKGDTDAEGSDRFVQSYISTIAKDRVNEVILPEGIMLDDYNLLKIVLFGHDYSALGMGKNQWIVPNDRSSADKMFSLLAKTIFASAKANPLAEQVYQWSLEDMPMGDSIGFIPIEWVEPNDKGWTKVYDAWVKRATAFLKTKGREATANMLEGLERIFTKVIMLEYSKVMMPCNQFAVSLAVKKGLLLESQAKAYTIPEDDDTEDAKKLTIIRRDLILEDGEEELPDSGLELITDEMWEKMGEITGQDLKSCLTDAGMIIPIVDPDSALQIPSLEKEGRVMSASMRKRISSGRDNALALASSLDAILTETEILTDGINEEIETKGIEEVVEEPQVTIEELAAYVNSQPEEKSQEEEALDKIADLFAVAKGEFR